MSLAMERPCWGTVFHSKYSRTWVYIKSGLRRFIARIETLCTESRKSHSAWALLRQAFLHGRILPDANPSRPELSGMAILPHARAFSRQSLFALSYD
jgi:hypothetical protein